VRHISNDGQHAVVLAIDELMKAEAITGNVMPLLTYIGRVLDSSPKFHALVSTLDPEVVGNITASSGRPVHWVPLSPISYKHSIEAVAKHRLKFRVSKGTPERPEFAERSLESEECCAVRAVIADCNGHPRSLEKSLRDPSDLQRGTTPPPAPSPPQQILVSPPAAAAFSFFAPFCHQFVAKRQEEEEKEEERSISFVILSGKLHA